MRGHLVDPFRHTGVDIAREDGHRPAVVARALHRVPGGGVARAVVDEVQLRIIGIPAPGRAAAGLPLLAFPCIQAGILADGLAEMRGLFRVDQRLGIRTCGIALPGQRSVLQIVRGDPAAHAILAAGNADDNLVLDDDRGVRAGFTLAAIGHFAILYRPDELAGLGVERRDHRVGLIEDDLAVAIGNATIDRIAAHDSDDFRILLGLIFPENPAVIVEVQRIHDVGEWRMNIHDVANHQRSAFVAAQHASGEGPLDLQVLHIVLVDLVQLGVARIGVVTRRHRPVLGVRCQLGQILVSPGSGREARQERHGKRNTECVPD